VVEAAERSGSLITVRFALEQGREVFAVPGSPLDPRAAGTNALLKQGATLVTQASDVIAVLAPILGSPIPQRAEPPTASSPAAPQPEDLPGTRDYIQAHIQALLGPTPIALDDVARLADASVADVRIAVLELELAGRIERHGGGLISLR
jgi:DNA processing protein